MSVPSSDDNPPLWRTLESSNATKKEVLEPYDINSPLYTSDSEIIKAITRDMIEMIVHVVESNASTKQVWSLENLENDAIRNIKFEFTYKNKNIKNHYSFPNHYTNIRENYKSQTRGISNSRRRNHGRNLSTNSNAKTYKHILTASKQLKFSINKGKKWLKDEHNIEHQSEFQHRSELNAESNARCSSNLKVVSEAYKTLSSPLLSCEKNVSTLKDERCFDISSDEDPNELIICEQSQVFAHSGFKLQNTSTKQNIESSTVLPACNEHHTRSTENIHATEKSGRTKRNVSLNVFQCDTNTCVLNSETKNVKNEEHQLKTQGEGVQNDKKINPFFTSCEKLCLENTRNVLRRKCSNCQELLQKYTFKEKHHTFDDNVDFRVNNYKNEPNDHHLVNEVSLSSSDDSVFTNDRIHNESGKATPSPSLEETMLTTRNSQSPNEDNHRPMKASNAAENRSKSINFKQHSNTIHSLFCEPQDEAIDLSKRRNSVENYHFPSTSLVTKELEDVQSTLADGNSSRSRSSTILKTKDNPQIYYNFSGTDVSKKTDESHSSSSQSSVFEESNVESSSLVPRNIETEIEVFCQKIKKSRNERNGEKSEDFDQSFKDELLSTYQRKSCLQFIRERMEVLRNEIFDLDSKAIEKQREKLLILQHRKRKQEKLNRIEKQQEIISQVRRLRLSKQPSRALQFADPHCEISETCIRDFTELETPLSRDDNVAQVLCSNSDQQSALHNLLLTKRDHSKNMKNVRRVSSSRLDCDSETGSLSYCAHKVTPTVDTETQPSLTGDNVSSVRNVNFRPPTGVVIPLISKPLESYISSGSSNSPNQVTKRNPSVVSLPEDSQTINSCQSHTDTTSEQHPSFTQTKRFRGFRPQPPYSSELPTNENNLSNDHDGENIKHQPDFFLPHNQVGKTPKLSFNYNYPSTISPSISVYFENQQCYLPLGKNCWNFVTEYAKAFAKQQSLKPSSAFDPQEQTAVPTQHKAENKSKDAVPSTGHLNKTLPQSQSVSSPNHTPTRVVRCSTCGALSPHFVCSGCAKEWYCNAKCQLKQWRHHSKFCLKK